MGGHDYAGCYRADCILCDVYQTGYADGKAKPTSRLSHGRLALTRPTAAVTCA